MKKLFKKIQDVALREGAQDVELYSINSKNLELRVYKGAMSSINKAEVTGIGVRVVSDGRLGYAYSNDLSMAEKIARDAAVSAKYTTKDKFNVLPHQKKVEPMDVYHDDIEKESNSYKIELLQKDESQALSLDKRIKPIDSIYGEEILSTQIINSLGVDYSYILSNCWRYIRVLAEQAGDAQSGFALTIGRSLNDLEKPEILGRKSARKALDMLGAKKIPSQKCNVILDSLVACQFLSLISHAVSAEAVLKGKSFLADKKDQDVAAPGLEIVDDGRLKNAPASTPVDDEGEPTKKTTIIKDSKLLGYLHNSYTAEKTEVGSTGNGFRSSYKSPPGISASNIYIGKGHLSKKQLLEQADECFYILDISGLHSGANPVNGEFSVGASGIWLKGGKKAHSVREATISGDMLKFLSNVQAIADDLEFYPFGGSCGSPSILVSDVILSGD